MEYRCSHIFLVWLVTSITSRAPSHIVAHSSVAISALAVVAILVFVRRYLPRSMLLLPAPRSPLPAPRSPLPSPLPSPLLPPRLTFYHSSLLNTAYFLAHDLRPTFLCTTYSLAHCPLAAQPSPLARLKRRAARPRGATPPPLSPPLPSSSVLTKF